MSPEHILNKFDPKYVFKMIDVDANWGSSTQSQTFLTALKGIHNLSKMEDHVKNYRPKVFI